MQNRSVPTNSVIPHVYYEDVAEAMAWLSKVFGFREHFRYGPPHSPQGGQINLGVACIQLHTIRPGTSTPKSLGALTQMVTVIVDDVRAHYEAAKLAGAKIDEDLNETIYGERQYSAIDFAGHRWLFSQHVQDLDPADWGAIVKRS
jgi:uncharacterized glyoxalase superfamily protein PhnB